MVPPVAGKENALAGPIIIIAITVITAVTNDDDPVRMHRVVSNTARPGDRP